MELQVYKHIHLPIRQTTKASCLETKKEVEILTGKWIHQIKIGNDLFVSPSLYKQMITK